MIFIYFDLLFLNSFSFFDVLNTIDLRLLNNTSNVWISSGMVPIPGFFPCEYAHFFGMCINFSLDSKFAEYVRSSLEISRIFWPVFLVSWFTELILLSFLCHMCPLKAFFFLLLF